MNHKYTQLSGPLVLEDRSTEGVSLCHLTSSRKCAIYDLFLNSYPQTQGRLNSAILVCLLVYVPSRIDSKP